MLPRHLTVHLGALDSTPVSFVILPDDWYVSSSQVHSSLLTSTTTLCVFWFPLFWALRKDVTLNNARQTTIIMKIYFFMGKLLQMAHFVPHIEHDNFYGMHE